MSIALIVCLIVPLLVCICCVASRVYRRNGRMSLRYQSALAAKRRNSVLALSTMDLSAAAGPGRGVRGVGGGGGGGVGDSGDDDYDDGGGDTSSTVGGSVPSSTNPRRSYDAVYRTHEPLPGKPDVQFEPDKVWDLDAEYEGQLDKVNKRTAIYVPGSPTTSAPPDDRPPAGQRSPGRNASFADGPPTGRRLPRDLVAAAAAAAAASDPDSGGPSVAVQRQILPSRFKDL